MLIAKRDGVEIARSETYDELPELKAPYDIFDTDVPSGVWKDDLRWLIHVGQDLLEMAAQALDNDTLGTPWSILGAKVIDGITIEVRFADNRVLKLQVIE